MRYFIKIKDQHDGRIYRYEVTYMTDWLRDNALEIIALGDHPGEMTVLKDDGVLVGPVPLTAPVMIRHRCERVPPHHSEKYYGG